MSPVHGKVSIVQVKEPYGNLDIVTPAEARVRLKDVIYIVNAEKYFYNSPSINLRRAALHSRYRVGLEMPVWLHIQG